MKRVQSLLMAGLVVTAFAVACGDDEPVQQVECGEGTELQSGECVPEEHNCPGDEILSPDGLCEDPDQFPACDEGTSYDRGEDKCISDADVVCGEGTVEVDNHCVIENPLECGPGTVLYNEECVVEEEVCGEGTSFDEDEIRCHPDEGACSDQQGVEFDVATGQCVDLSIVECGAETVEVDDRCLPLDTYADELAADADIDYADGEPIVVSDDKFIFTGALDDDLSQTFALEGLEGQWVEISIYSRGLPSPGFSLTKQIGSWERAVRPGLQSVPTRTVLLPEETDYELSVETTLTYNEDWNDGGQDGWDYVGTAEVLDAPDSVAWDALNEIYLGDLKQPTQNFIEVDTDEVFDLLVSTPAIGGDAHDVTAEVWTEPDEYHDRYDLSVGQEIAVDVSDMSTVYLHLDAVEFNGPFADIELAGRSTELLEPNDTYEIEIDAEPGETVMMTHESNEAEPVDIDIRLDGSQKYLLTDAPAYNQSSFDDMETMRQFFYSRDGGTYTIEFRNSSFDDITSFIATAYTEDVPVFEVPEDGSHAQFSADVEADELEAGDWRFVVLDTPDRGYFNVRNEADDGNPRASVYSDFPRDQIANTSGSSGTAELEFQAPDEGIYYVVSRPWSSWSLVSDLEFNIDGRVVEALEPGEVLEKTFDVDAFDAYTGEVNFILGDEAQVRLVNSYDEVLFEETFSGELGMVDIFPGTGEYTFEIENVGDETIVGPAIDVIHHKTFDSFSIGASLDQIYQRGALAAGETETVVIRAPSDDRVLTADAVFGADIDAELRLWDIEDAGLAAEATGSDEISVGATIDPDETYILEIKAISDATDGYDLTLEDTDISVVYEEVWFDPPTIVDPGDEVEFPLNVDGCSSVLGISVETDIPATYSFGLDVDLHVPSLSDPIRLRDGSGPDSGIYPDDIEPEESLDPVLGQSGNGEWAVEIINGAFFTDTEFAGWSLTLTCPE